MKSISLNTRPIGLALGFVFCLATALSAETITGTVTNKTTNKPSAGDDVILLKLVQNMPEAGRTKTDASGHFTLKFADDGAQHLVRVNHDKVNYHQPVPPGKHEVHVDVYDVAPKVAGVSGSADVFRVQADAGQLQVTELIALKNESNPPRSQMGPSGFEFYIPENAVIDATVAGGPGGMPVNVGAVPLEPKGHYGVIFPVRPGETRLQIAYHIPYTGSAAFSPHLTLPMDNVGILLPKGMQIKSDAFKESFEENGALVYVIKGAQPNQSLGFTISGTGQLPDSDAGQENAAQAQAPAGAPPVAGAANNRPGGGIGTPEEGVNPLQKYKWWILGGLGLAFAVGAFFVLRTSPAVATEPAPVQASGSGGNSQISVLKEELFRLETDKVQGLISETEYAQTRAALEVVLRRALGKGHTAKEA